VEGSPTLYSAVYAEHQEVVECLLKAGADPNAAVTDSCFAGQTPLMAAAQRANSNLTMILLNAGANPALLTARGESALTHTAGVWPYSRRAERAGQDVGDLISDDDIVATLNLLATAGCPVTVKTDGDTLLMTAAKNGRLPVLEWVLSTGTQDIKAKDSGYRGWTALHCAADSGHIDAVEFLLAHGADGDARTADGLSWQDLLASKRERAAAPASGSGGGGISAATVARVGVTVARASVQAGCCVVQ
jgi:ankyrin repeat protein